VARLALITYAGLLSASLLVPAGRAGVAGAGLFDLRTGTRIRAVAVAFAAYALVEVLRFVPVGILAVLSVPRVPGDQARVLLLAAAAGAGSLIITGLVLTREIGWQLSTATQISPRAVTENSPPPRVHSVASAGRTRPALSLSLSR